MPPVEPSGIRASGLDPSHLVWRNTLAIGLARFSSIGFDGLAYILTARYFGPSEYGSYLAINAVLNIVDLAADMTLMDVSVREMSLTPSLAGNWLGAMTVLRLAIALLGMAGFAVYLAITNNLSGNLLSALIAALVLPVGALRTPLALFRARMKMEYELGVVLTTRCANLVIVLVLIQQGAGLLQFFAGTLASRALLAILAWACVWMKFRVPVRTSLVKVKQLTRECLPMGVSGLFVAVQLKVDIILLASLSGVSVAGLYGAVAQLPEYSLYLVVILTTPMLPMLSHAFGGAAMQKFNTLFQKMLNAILIVITPLALVGLLLPETSVVLLFGQQYLPVAHVLPLLVMATVAMWISHATAIAVVAAGLQSHFMWIQPICVLLYLVLNCLLVPRWGATAAASIRLLTCSIAPLLTYWVVRRKIGMRISRAGTGRIALAAVSMGLTLALCSALPLLLSSVLGCAVYSSALWFTRPQAAGIGRDLGEIDVP
jgi:O-antigen/teichoic acid export membrane protein